MWCVYCYGAMWSGGGKRNYTEGKSNWKKKKRVHEGRGETNVKREIMREIVRRERGEYVKKVNEGGKENAYK